MRLVASTGLSHSKSIGEDIAKFLAKWARGESLEQGP